jgi:hypothetical protein
MYSAKDTNAPHTMKRTTVVDDIEPTYSAEASENRLESQNFKPVPPMLSSHVQDKFSFQSSYLYGDVSMMSPQDRKEF